VRFDLLIKGGQVVDPGGGHQGMLDVAVVRDRIAAVDRDIPADSAARTIDAAGRLVTPGLVDLHTHIYRGVTYWGVDADSVGSRTGVTTWLDVGSAGAMTVQGFRDWIAEPARVRIYGLLNISYVGLVGPDYELANLAYCDVGIFRRAIDQHRDLMLGVKVRMGATTVGENGLEPLRRAVRAAEECGLPLMVHIAIAPPAVEEILPLLRPGDILTHCFTGQTMRIVDDEGRLLEAARRAWDSGVIMDIGHGSGSFSFETAEALLGAGRRPDVISSDIHQLSVRGPMFDMPTTLSKFLALGLPLTDAIRAATARPAEVLGLERQIGTLRPGSFADVALFELERGRFPFYDIHGAVREGGELLRSTLTIVGGRPLPLLPEPPPPPWIEPGPIWPEFQAGLVGVFREALARDDTLV
jgi:dihydroorotase